MPNILFISAVIFASVLSPDVPGNADDPSTRWPRSVDVFTTTKLPIESVEEFADKHPETTVRVHVLDGIELLEDELSHGLSAQPEQAKRQALKRLQRLSKETQTQLEHTAKGVALAIEFGINRYPAIVFNKKQVVYGVTDLSRAVSYYHSWQTRHYS